MNKVFVFASFFLSITLTGCSDSSDSPPVAALSAPQSDCLWTIELTPGVDEADNVYSPERNAAYWVAIFDFPEDALCFSLEGAFPYSRYMSMNNLNFDTGLSVDSILDQEIVPDLGSTNPFLPGNPRNDPSRIYTVSVQPMSDQVDCPLPNQTNAILTPYGFARITYRVYLPNAGADLSGNAGLPQVTLYMADGRILQGEEACAVISPYEPGVQLTRFGFFSPEEYAEMRGSNDPSENPPIFRNTLSRRFHRLCEFGDDCSIPPPNLGTESPPDSRILYTFTSRTHGEVLVIRAKLPLTPLTSQGEDSAIEGDMRYWSACSYEYYAERAEDCLYDEQVQNNEDGYYTIVFSREEDRPDNATSECGVSYLRWSENGDGFGVEEGYENHPDDGHLFFRNLLPSPDFAYAIPPLDVFAGEAQIGDYLPKGKYFSKEDFEALGCNPWLSIPYSEM